MTNRSVVSRREMLALSGIAATPPSRNGTADKGTRGTGREFLEAANERVGPPSDAVRTTQNLADLRDPEAATGNLRIRQGSPAAMSRSVRDVLRDLPISPLAFGAVADGLSDDRKALQDAIDFAASIRRTVDLSGYSFAIAGEVRLQRNSVVLGPGAITQLTAGKGVFTGANISNVRIRNLKLKGPGSAHLIDRDRSKAAIYLVNCEDVGIENLSAREFYNIFTQIGGSQVRINGCTFKHFYLYGVVLSAVDGFIVSENTIHTCDQSGAANAYCITATGDDAGGDGQFDNIISHNLLYGVPSWDAVMTHEVARLSCIGNIIRDVRVGFDISAASSGNTLKDIVIADNIIELTTRNTWGSAAAQHGGIYVGGVQGSVIDGVSIHNNIIVGANNIPLGRADGYGGNSPAAIALQYARNVTVHGNILKGLGAVASFSGISATAMGDGLQINNNIAEGALINGYMIRVQNIGNGTTSHVSVRGNQCLLPSAVAHTLFHSGRFSDVIYRDNTSSTATAAYATAGSPTVQLADMAATVATPSGGATVDAECRAQLVALLTSLRNAQIIA